MLIRNSNTFQLHRNNTIDENVNIFYFTDNYDVSCYSIKLNETLPEISRIVRFLPELQVTDTCIETSRKLIILVKFYI